MNAMQAVTPAVDLDAGLLPLFRELGDLKRIHSAGRPGSIASRLFQAAWAGLVSGIDVAEVTLRTTAAAVAAARLGDLDLTKLLELEVDHAAAVAILERAFNAVAAAVAPDLAMSLRNALAAGPLPAGDVPPFVLLLAEQPRAGVTAPGKPRIMLTPAENHAEHSLVVAVYGVLAAPAFGADPVDVFLAGMAHHLHSAAMPDSGYAGEVLLGKHLGTVIATARAQAAAQLSPELRARLDRATAPLASDRTAAARAFHAADVIDRVLEIEQHLAAQRVDMALVLDDYGLVHDGPVKPFHDRVLAAVGLP